MNPFDSYSSPSLAPFNNGVYVILREPLRGTPHTRYIITLKGERIGSQLSFPGMADCQWHDRWGKVSPSSMTTRRAPVRTFESPTLTGRIIEVLKIEKMGLTALANALNTEANALAAILTRLVNAGRIQRRGPRGSYVYQAGVSL